MAQREGSGRRRGPVSSMTGGKVAVIGLGLIGSRISKRLSDAGFSIRGYDIDTDRLAEFERSGGDPAATLAEAVQGCWAALLSLPTSQVSREVCLGPGGLSESGSKGLYVYDTTTGRPGDAADIAAALRQLGIDYSDATLSGNSAMAATGELVVMVGGTEAAFRSGAPLFEAIGRSHHHMGAVGSGSRTKLIVNHALAVHRMALAEALVVAELSGLSLTATLDVLEHSLAYSKAMDVWGDRMVTADHEPPFSRLRQGHKDAGLIVDHANELGAPSDLIRTVNDALAEGVDGGLGDLDASSIIEVIRRRAGIGRVPGATN